MARRVAFLKRLIALALCAGQLCCSWPLDAQETAQSRTGEPGVAAIPPALPMDLAGPDAAPVLGAYPPSRSTLPLAAPAAPRAAAAPPAPASYRAAVRAVPAAAQAARAAPASPAPAKQAGRPALESLVRTGARLGNGPNAGRAALDAGFDARAGGGAPDDEAPEAKPEDAALKEVVKGLARLRRDGQKDARSILIRELGGDVGDGKLHRDLERVLRRLLDAAGLPREAAQIFIGGSYLPNAFTTLTDSEAAYFKDHAGIAKAFRIGNVFLSLGLLRAVKNEEQLALVLAHELMHHLKGHLKGSAGSRTLLGHIQEAEADVEGLKLVAKAGYDPGKAVDMLYALDAEYDRLEKNYSLLGRKKNDVLETIQRARDVHPHPDLRKAEMLQRMNEALELYKPRPVPQNPVWLRRRDAAVRPTHLDRFERNVKKAIREGDVETRLHELEALIRTLAAKRRPNIEEYAIIEEGYRSLAKLAGSAEELRFIEVSTRRLADGGFPSKRLKASLVARQLELAIGKGKRINLLEFEALAARLGERERLAGTLRILGEIETRPQLDAAYRALSREAENIGLSAGHPKGVLPGDRKTVRHEVSQKLWRATRGVLTAELGRPAAPEEIIAELAAKISPAWLQSYHEALQAEILETAFQSEPFRSSKHAPSQLATLLQGRAIKEPEKGKADEDVRLQGLAEWTRRHWRDHSFVQAGNGDVLPRYERFYLDGLTSPSPRDQLDIARRFWDSREGKDNSGQYPVTAAPLPRPFVELLRREGKLGAFLDAMMAESGVELKRKLAGSATEEQRRAAREEYARQSKLLLRSALKGVRDFRVVRETVEAVWTRTEGLLGAPKADGALESYLTDAFFISMSDALRRAVIQADAAGSRPDAGELQKIAELARRMDARLRPFPAAELVKAHARNLGANLGNGRKYMLAYEAAEPRAVGDRLKSPAELAKWFWLPVISIALALLVNAAMRLSILPLAAPLVAGAVLPQAAVISGLILRRFVIGWGTRPPGAARSARSLDPQDFVHFLAALGDPSLDAETKLTSALLLDRLDFNADTGEDLFGRAVGMRASMKVGRWLLEDAVAAARTGPELDSLVQRLLRVNALHPGFLQSDARYQGSTRKSFKTGAAFVRRNEPLRSVAEGRHPFRGSDSRWAAELARRLDELKAWPKTTAERLDLLDLMNSSGEFSDELDRRVLETAEGDRAGFLAWAEADRRRARDFDVQGSGAYSEKNLVTPFGHVPLPRAEPLRIVRNPALRARLFDLLPEAEFGEKAPFSWKRRLKNYKDLLSAFRRAKKYFSGRFLDGMRHEGSLEEKFIQVIEEADRYAAAEAAKFRERWDKGKFTQEDLSFLGDRGEFNQCGGQYAKIWKNLLPYKKQDIAAEYKRRKRVEALEAIHALYSAYAEAQDPALGLILKNYPEPTRSRDELLERVMKARRLTPGQLSLFEGNKSYRLPNPVRVMEKQFLEAALIQLRKFSPAERVDILLHLAGAEKLPKERLDAFNRRVLSGDRKKLARDYGAVRGIAQLQNYMSLLHAQDRSMLVRAQFHGENSLHRAPAEVERLYEKLVMDGRGLPPFVRALLRAYFKLLTDDEKSRLIGDLAAFENVGKDLKGPQIVRIALKGLGVTGAKVAQVLVTHKGLLPPEYAAELEGFKDRAQDLEKMRIFSLAGARLDGLSGAGAFPDGEGVPSRAELDALTAEAVPELAKTKDEKGRPASPKGPGRLRRLVAAQVEFLLKEQNRRIRSIEALGRELCAGSIKVVYKATLDDGKVWVVKLRAPGAAYGVRREFEILENLVDGMQARGELDLPGAKQLLGEVRALVRAEMNFVNEAKRERSMRARIAARPWYAPLFGFPAPYVPKPHQVFAAEDLLVEEFVPSARFADLPRRALLGPSRNKLAALAVREGMFDLVAGSWLEPDPHAGNRQARRGPLYRFATKLVVMDLGQGRVAPIGRLKPLMKAALALEAGDAAGAAEALAGIVKVPENRTKAEITAALADAFSKPKDGVVERLMEGLFEAEKKGALILPEYAALQKAFILYMGYSPYLPKDYLFEALEDAAALRLWRDGAVRRPRLAWLWLKRTILGRKAVRAETAGFVDKL